MKFVKGDIIIWGPGSGWLEIVDVVGDKVAYRTRRGELLTHSGPWGTGWVVSEKSLFNRVYDKIKSR